MLDYISTELVGINPTQLLRNPAIPFRAPVNLDTGEVDSYFGCITHTAKYRELEFKVRTYEGRQMNKVTIKGSLHKFAKGNNHTDFSHTEIKNAIAELCDLISCAPENCLFRAKEFGINVNTILPPQFYINNILTHGYQSGELRNYKGSGLQIKFPYSNHHIKIYDKSMQCLLPDFILRYEIHAEKMAYFQTKGLNISNLYDMFNPAIYDSLKDIALKSFDSFIFTDDRINLDELTNDDRAVFTEFSNPRYWSMPKANRTQRQRAKNRFYGLITKYAPDDIKQDIRNLIESKWDFLIHDVTILPQFENGDMLRFDTHIVSNKVTPQRQCLTCGRDITNQRPGSLYCSEVLHGREVKKCRNIVSNLKVHEQRFYPGLTLFSIDDYLTPEHRRIKDIAFKTLIYQ